MWLFCTLYLVYAVILYTCQPTPRLRTDGGSGVALAYLDTAKKAPVDCHTRKT